MLFSLLQVFIPTNQEPPLHQLISDISSVSCETLTLSPVLYMLLITAD